MSEWPVDSGNEQPTATPSVVEQPKKNNKTLIIVIVAVILVLLLCCCIGAGIWLWNNGDQLIQEMSAVLPAAAMLL